jgi:hypothetical protein
MSKLELVFNTVSGINKYTISNVDITLEVVEEKELMPELARKVVFNLEEKKIHRFYQDAIEVSSFRGEGKWSAGPGNLELIEKKSGDSFFGFETSICEYKCGSFKMIHHQSRFPLIRDYLQSEYLYLLGDFYLLNDEEPFVFRKYISSKDNDSILHELVSIKELDG